MGAQHGPPFSTGTSATSIVYKLTSMYLMAHQWWETCIVSNKVENNESRRKVAVDFGDIIYWHIHAQNSSVAIGIMIVISIGFATKLPNWSKRSRLPVKTNCKCNSNIYSCSCTYALEHGFVLPPSRACDRNRTVSKRETGFISFDAQMSCRSTRGAQIARINKARENCQIRSNSVYHVEWQLNKATHWCSVRCWSGE